MIRYTDVCRLLANPHGGLAVVVALAILAAVFAWQSKGRRMPRRGGPPRKFPPFLRSPALWGMVAAAGILTWFFWPVLSAWTLLFWAFPLLSVCLDGGSGDEIVCSLAGYRWSINDFCRGWLITGDTGSGKTFALRKVMHQVFARTKQRPWGGLLIDEKGDEVKALVEIAARHGRSQDVFLLETRPDDAPADWQPKERFNLLSDLRIPSSTYAKALVDTAAMTGGKEGEQAFFRNQSLINIGEGIELLRVMGRVPTVSDLLEVLRYRDILNGCLREVESKAQAQPQSEGAATAARVVNHFRNSFLRQPEEQLGGIISTIETFLLFFTKPEIAEVFCTAENTFDFDMIEHGGIIAVSMPQKLSVERRYLNCLLKLLYYQHVRQRFRVKDKSKLNLLVLWQDEVQRFISEADGDVDIMRSARGTSVMATQSKMSLFPPLGGKEKAQVTILNLRNRIMFTAADKDCGELSADLLGKRQEWKRSISSGKGGRNTSRSEEENYWIRPAEFMTLPKFHAVLRHASGRWKRCLVTPVDNRNRVPRWFKKGQY